MTQPSEIQERIYEAIRTASEPVATTMHPALRLDDLGIPSLRAAMIIMSVAEESGIDPSQLEFRALDTVGDLVSCLAIDMDALTP